MKLSIAGVTAPPRRRAYVHSRRDWPRLDVAFDLCELFAEARRVPAAPTPKRIIEDGHGHVGFPRRWLA